MSGEGFGEVIGRRLPDDPEPLTLEVQEIYESMERHVRLHPPNAEERARWDAIRRDAEEWHLPENLDE